ncbi:MAG: PIN domain-containing protein [Candidatus Methanoperedens sp.]|nr:PIN domain-containing protein [Candidatus Methanoperedens sp.]MCZ7406506.1 PIN domain-containing protein [Candidatus Methanoperedens sp.]
MKTNRFFLDTAYVLALLNPNDVYHKQAKVLLVSMHSAREVWITEAVLIEIGNALARSNRIAAAAFINSCYTTPNVRVVSVDTSLLKRALDFYNNRGDKEWGLTDCISFLVMTDQGLKEALTTDEHFQQAGFRALLLD